MDQAESGFYDLIRMFNGSKSLDTVCHIDDESAPVVERRITRSPRIMCGSKMVAMVSLACLACSGEDLH